MAAIMTIVNLVMFLCVLGISASDWASEWMSPVQDEFKEYPEQYKKSNPEFREEDLRLPFAMESTQNPYYLPKTNDDLSTARLKAKLQATLDNANRLSHTLSAQITEITIQEHALKDAIANGRFGVTTVMVHTIGQLPRSYIIREGMWTLCTGAIHPPIVDTALKGLFSIPRCFGQEVPTRPDPCVFNSIIKYETIPVRRRVLYVEDDYLCLKPSFNETLEQYLSVPRRVINETCTEGNIRSLTDNEAECGIRVLTEYSYYPDRSFNSPRLPLEYCTEENGSCKLIVAWHLSNSSIENFEFLKNEPSFKNYFIKSDSHRRFI